MYAVGLNFVCTIIIIDFIINDKGTMKRNLESRSNPHCRVIGVNRLSNYLDAPRLRFGRVATIAASVRFGRSSEAAASTRQCVA
jgi:hypothetical protein